MRMSRIVPPVRDPGVRSETDDVIEELRQRIDSAEYRYSTVSQELHLHYEVMGAKIVSNVRLQGFDPCARMEPDMEMIQSELGDYWESVLQYDWQYTGCLTDNGGSPVTYGWSSLDGYLMIKVGEAVYFLNKSLDRLHFALLRPKPTNIPMMLGVRQHLAGRVVLHGNAIERDGKGYILLGTSGAGKSTLTASFALRQSRIVSDDVSCLIENGTGWSVYPGTKAIRLCPIAATTLAATDLGNSAEDGSGKIVLSGPAVSSWFSGREVPIAVLYELNRSEEGLRNNTPCIVDVTCRDALVALMKSTFGLFVESPPEQQDTMDRLAELVKRVPVKRLSFGSTFSSLPEVCDLVEHDMAL